MLFILRILLAILIAVIAATSEAYRFGITEWALCLFAIFALLLLDYCHALLGDTDASGAAFERIRKARWFMRTVLSFRLTIEAERPKRPMSPAE